MSLGAQAETSPTRRLRRWIERRLCALCRRAWSGVRNEHSAAFSLIELMIVVAMTGTIAAIGLPEYMEALEKARIARAIGDIVTAGEDIRLFYLDNRRVPDSLAEVGYGNLRDPWGEPYEYVPVVQPKNPKQKPQGYRKDHFMTPLNSDYDMWSNGKDGTHAPPLTAPQSRDDIVRALDGAWVGLAETF
jgi:general secretion pathway protein G